MGEEDGQEGDAAGERDSAMLMTKLATRAPTGLPIPPRMVMAKALMVRGKPTAG